MRGKEKDAPLILPDDKRVTGRFPEITGEHDPSRIENMGDVLDVWMMISDGVKEGNLMARDIGEITDLRGNFILSRKEKEIVGCVGLDIYTHRIAEIRSLYVKPNHRGEGIGTNLINQAIERAKDRHIHELITVTDKIDMFTKSGFHEILNNQKALFMRLGVKL